MRYTSDASPIGTLNILLLQIVFLLFGNFNYLFIKGTVLELQFGTWMLPLASIFGFLAGYPTYIELLDLHFISKSFLLHLSTVYFRGCKLMSSDFSPEALSTDLQYV